jgi:hypothetical protein
MNVVSLHRRTLQSLAVIVVMAGTATVAEARMGSIGMGSPRFSSTMTTVAPGHTTGHGYGYGSYTPPPYNYGADRPRGSSDQSGSSASFNSGGSGTKPIKKPNLQ